MAQPTPGRKKRGVITPGEPGSQDGPPAGEAQVPDGDVADGPAIDGVDPAKPGGDISVEHGVGEDEQEPIEDFRTPADPPTPEEAAGELASENGDSDPTAPIGRAHKKKSGLKEEPQASFGDEVIPVEDGEADFLDYLLARRANQEAHQRYEAACREIQKGLVRMGYKDAKPHTLRAGPFLITIAPSDAEPIAMNFTREPPIYTKIKFEG